MGLPVCRRRDPRDWMRHYRKPAHICNAPRPHPRRDSPIYVCAGTSPHLCRDASTRRRSTPHQSFRLRHDFAHLVTHHRHLPRKGAEIARHVCASLHSACAGHSLCVDASQRSRPDVCLAHHRARLRARHVAQHRSQVATTLPAPPRSQSARNVRARLADRLVEKQLPAHARVCSCQFASCSEMRRSCSS
jgi:hypothetical protein